MSWVEAFDDCLKRIFTWVLNNFRLDSICHILTTSVVFLHVRFIMEANSLLPPAPSSRHPYRSSRCIFVFLIGETTSRSVENHFWWLLLMCDILFHFPTRLFIRSVCVNSIATCDRESCVASAHTVQNIYSPGSSIVLLIELQLEWCFYYIK